MESLPLIDLEALVAFLNQRCDEDGLVIWRDPYCLSLVYQPYFDAQALLGGVTLPWMKKFYKKSVELQQWAIWFIRPIIESNLVSTSTRSSDRQEEFYNDLFAGVEPFVVDRTIFFEASEGEYANLLELDCLIICLLLGTLVNDSIWNVAICPQCQTFFTRAHVSKDRYCSSDCYYRRNVAESGFRQCLSRLRRLEATGTT